MIPPSRDAGDPDAVRAHFRWFAERDAPDASPLYARLAGIAARDIALAGFLDAAPPTQRRPTLFLAAIHYLLLQGAQHDLRAFYPNLVDTPRADDPEPALRDFVARHGAELRALATTRATQTNEAGRCSNLVLAFARAHELTGRPLALIELGPSAGFLLNADRYFYDFGRAGTLGDRTSPLHLRPEVRGDIPPPVPAAMPEIAWRAGIDLDPVDARDDDAIGWLRACIWPEQSDRFARFDAAVAIARAYPPRMVQGDAVETLSAVAREVPGDATLCVFHSAFLAYLPERSFAAVPRAIAAIAHDRDVVWIPAEGLRSTRTLFPELEAPPTQPAGALALAHLRGGRRRAWLLALAGYHGQWMRWTDPGTLDIPWVQSVK